MEFIPGDRVQMRKCKYDGTPVWTWYEIVWHADGDYLVFYEEPGTAVHATDHAWKFTRYALLHFWPDRPYYILELYRDDSEHSFEGWYCNIQMAPQRTELGFQWIDLDLDLWVYPDLSMRILDEEEYRENLIRFDYPEETRRLVERTRDELLALVAARRFPFRDHVTNLDIEMSLLAARFQIER